MSKKEIVAKSMYHFDTDTYAVRPIDRKYESSYQIGNFIFDMDKDDTLTGIEILNVSKVFGVPKIFLKNQISGKVKIQVTSEYIKLNFIIESVVRNSNKTSTLSVERIKPDFLKPVELNFAVA